MRLNSYRAPWGQCFAEGVALDFGGSGIYLVRGGNGTGKTTLLEHLALGDGDVSFSNAQEDLSYRTCRGTLLSYVPQRECRPPCTVDEYLGKGRGLVDEAALARYRQELGVGSIDGGMRLEKVSGGELKRLALALALAKPVSYVILDEPSNYLDDASALALGRIMQEEGQKRAIILSTHDPRLNLAPRAICQVHHQAIEWSCCSGGEATAAQAADADSLAPGASCPADLGARTVSHPAEPPALVASYPAEVPAPGSIARSLQLRAPFWLVRLLAAVVCANLLLWCGLQLQAEWCVPEGGDAGIILASGSLGGDFAELNETYAEGVGLEVPLEGRSRSLTYADLAQVAAVEGVTDVYVENPTFAGDPTLESDSSVEFMSADMVADLLSSGEFIPFDTADLPARLKRAGESEGMDALVSWAIVTTDEGAEESAVSFLVQRYPATYVDSAWFSQVWADQMNLRLMLRILAVTVAASLLAGGLLWAVASSTLADDKVRLEDLAAWYLQDRGIGKAYCRWGVVLLLGTVALCAVVGAVCLPALWEPMLAAGLASGAVMTLPFAIAQRQTVGKVRV